MAKVEGGNLRAQLREKLCSVSAVIGALPQTMRESLKGASTSDTGAGD